MSQPLAQYAELLGQIKLRIRQGKTRAVLSPILQQAVAKLQTPENNDDIKVPQAVAKISGDSYPSIVQQLVAQLQLRDPAVCLWGFSKFGIALLAIKMRFQFCFRDVPRCLADYSFESSLVQLGMGRNCERLFRAIGEHADQLDMAALLSRNGKAEERKYLDDILTGESFQLRHGRGNLFRGWR